MSHNSLVALTEEFMNYSCYPVLLFEVGYKYFKKFESSASMLAWGSFLDLNISDDVNSAFVKSISAAASANA